MNTFVISLGGSLVSPEATATAGQAGRVDVVFLKKFRALILKYVKCGHRFAIIVGGGKLARVWQEATRELITPPAPSYLKRGLRSDLDWVGIRATQANAEVVRAMFGVRAHPEIVPNPAEKVGKFKILIGAGYIPGHSTDYDAVVRAKSVGAKTVVNLSNVDSVYDKDPRKFKDAKILERVSWAQYRKMFGMKWMPGANVPFDQKAAAEAAHADMRVVFLGGRDLKNFENFLQGRKFKGTVIG